MNLAVQLKAVGLTFVLAVSMSSHGARSKLQAKPWFRPVAACRR